MSSALVVGGGISGTATAIVLARSGFDVTLAEREPEWSALGSGITMIGPGLRALDRLGLLDAALAEGAGVTEVAFHSPTGELLQRIPLPQLLGPDRPGLLGMMRPTLHRLLAEASARAGVVVKTGSEALTLAPADHTVAVGFASGDVFEYDLVVGADGVHSQVRSAVFGDHAPLHSGQRVSRVVLPRHPDLTLGRHYLGNPQAKVGFTPTGAETMYMFCNTPEPEPRRIPQEEWPALVHAATEGFGGVVAEVREQIDDPTKIDSRPPPWLVVPTPWHRGRIVLVGDAAHTTTPHLAAGAAIALEDAIVLGEELRRAGEMPAALDAYSRRRFQRCRYVVETSVTLAQWEVHPETPGAGPAALSIEATDALAQPF